MTSRAVGRWAAVALSALLLVAAGPLPGEAADPPSWLLDVAKLPEDPADAGAGAVVLLDDIAILVKADGTQTTTHRRAVRVLTRDGQDAATLREVYPTSAEKTVTARGWILAQNRTTELGKDSIADVGLADNDVFSESKARVVTGGKAAAPGVVFGAEIETVEQTIFTQVEWTLQHYWPVKTARRSLTLPTGGTVRSLTLNGSAIEPVRQSGAYVWTAQNIPGLRLEPWSPPPSALTPRLLVTFTLGSQNDTAFESWGAVSGWLTRLTEPQASATPALAAKARELVAGATTDLDRVRAIGRFAQQVQYISIQTGLGRGGGYKPRAAGDVLAKNYGDCKDKANLVKALLATIGIKAYLVPIYSGDPDYVRQEWPSPQQFNHAIVAVALTGSVSPEAASTHPTLGQLLFFDPTDEQTPVGALPRYLQGSLGLLVAPGGELVRMPASKPESQARIRSVQGTLGADGALAATIRMVAAGEAASDERRSYKRLSKADYSAALERDLARQLPGAQMVVGQIADDATANIFQLELTLNAAGFAQTVNSLLLVRPPVITRLDLPDVGRSNRTQPVQLEFAEWRDLFEVQVGGLAVDELPETIERTTPFGRFSVRWQSDGTRLVRSAVLQLIRTSIPAAQTSDVVAFVDLFRNAERQPAVLMRK